MGHICPGATLGQPQSSVTAAPPNASAGALARPASWHTSHAAASQERRRRMTSIASHRIARAAAGAFLCLAAAAAHAQDTPVPPRQTWTWSGDGNVFVGYNYQQRHFADFSAWESQNWLMGMGERVVGNGRLVVHTMASFEPFTIGRLVYGAGQQIRAGGSPQLFQTGESFEGIPLVNYQHPHDLVMGLGATYRYVKPRTTYIVGADLVGSPTLGPTAFMHRESARNNPQVPITHHFLDSTHISTGVVRAGIETRGFTLEASAFRGVEPDDHRTNIEKPALDSWAARLGYRRGPWSAQFSGGLLHEPEWYEPYDHTRLTASIGFDGTVGGRRLDATFAWGQNRAKVVENGVSDGFLLEWNLAATPKTGVYGRAEIAVKQLFGLGLHPRGFEHPHVYSHIDALTIGGVRDIVTARWSRIGVGADLTVYHMSPDLLEFYEGSRSFHVFLRWRPAAISQGHVH
jgi:hypothetical protein